MECAQPNKRTKSPNRERVLPGSHNGFGSGRRSTAIVIVLCLFACRRSTPTVQGNQMRTALTDLAGAEDVYYATNLRYSANQSTIVSLAVPSGVTLTIESADEHGWRASASHEFGVETCYESGRNDGNAAFAVVEGPTCKPLRLSATLRDVRGRTAMAVAPVDSNVPAHTAPAAPAVAPTTAETAEGISLLLPVEGAQTENFGYPAQTIDRLAVRQLLLAKSYDVLDRVLAAYADSVRRDYRVEYRLFDAYEAFDVAMPSLEPLLTEWVQQRPKSEAALLARASFFRASGWNARGAKYSEETTNQQFERMRDFFQRSVNDLVDAHHLEPNSIVAYRGMMSIATSQGDVAASRRMLDLALKIQPYSFVLRVAHMHNLLPRWGGSYEAMARFAEESAPYAKGNPRIKALRGFVDWDKGRVLEAAGKKGDAIEAYQRALQFGDFWQFRYERGTYYSRSDLNQEALEDLNSVLLQYPQNDDALSERATVEYELGRNAYSGDQTVYYTQAFRDIALAAALDPANNDYQKDLAFYRENIPEFAPPPQQ